MNIKWAFGFVVYWLLLAAFYNFGIAYISDSYVPEYNESEFHAVNFTAPTTLVTATSDFEKVGQTILFVFLGLGLPADTPLFMVILCALVQTAMTAIAILLIFDAFQGFFGGGS